MNMQELFSHEFDAFYFKEIHETVSHFWQQKSSLSQNRLLF